MDIVANQVKSATGNILNEAITGKGFSYASMVKGASLADVLCWSTQSKFCQEWDMMILDNVLEQNGFDPYVLKPHLAPNIPDEPTEWSIADLINAATPNPSGMSLISADEFRENIKKLGHWTLLPETEKPPTSGDLSRPQSAPPAFPAQAQAGQGQLDPATVKNMQAADTMRQQMKPAN
jgi:hypothetical protein